MKNDTIYGIINIVDIKRSVSFIRNNKLKYYTKEILKIFSFITIAIEIISILIFTKYRPVYAVTLSNQEIGYITNENEFKQTIDNEISNINTSNVDNISFSDDVNYKLVLLSKNQDKVDIYKISGESENFYYGNAMFISSKIKNIYVLKKVKIMYETIAILEERLGTYKYYDNKDIIEEVFNLFKI